MWGSDEASTWMKSTLAACRSATAWRCGSIAAHAGHCGVRISTTVGAIVIGMRSVCDIGTDPIQGAFRGGWGSHQPPSANAVCQEVVTLSSALVFTWNMA